MKICKNCGHQADDNKIRCPYCGYLFEDEMDSVLQQMKDNLKSYKNSITPAQGAATASQPLPQAGVQQSVQPESLQSAAPVDPQRERFDLISEVAQLRGEMRAIHSEISRMNGIYPEPQQTPQTVQTQTVQTQAAQQPVQSQIVAGVQPYPAQPYVVQPYVAQPYVAQPGTASAAYSVADTGKKKTERSKNRIVLSVICILLLALSITAMFFSWVNMSSDGVFAFSGFDSILYLFSKDSDGAALFAVYLADIESFGFIGNEAVANVCRIVCRYVVEYGIIAYAAFLVLSFPLLFTMFGKISFKGWHRFVSWMAFIIALALFGVFCWVSGFSAVTIWFLAGAGANLLRCLFLAFYRGQKKPNGGLQ